MNFSNPSSTPMPGFGHCSKAGRRPARSGTIDRFTTPIACSSVLDSGKTIAIKINVRVEATELPQFLA